MFALAILGSAPLALASIEPAHDASGTADDGWQVLAASAPANAPTAAASTATAASGATVPPLLATPDVVVGGPVAAIKAAAPVAGSSVAGSGAATAATGASDPAAGDGTGGAGGTAGATDAQYTLHLVPSGPNLRSQLQQWLVSVGWQFAWDRPRDVDIAGAPTYRGSVVDIVTQVLNDLQGGEMSLAMCVYDNPAIRIVGDVSECRRGAN
ncbi:TcpQ domain-containing protein [Paraburkholderia unamae]|uniref:Toxin co-regulated pilus biosynthesis protein Q n=1 Tax=Paraburkholderia unamae TaxID=219649 RepID=A0ABX5KU98_9BURK|nr:TcpQ domain-containing protein [Paraburkholderia unamae]PVX85834.1 toxin co-regulated pilus biosynthesis protein Q [Paraburkholderia unamae]